MTWNGSNDISLYTGTPGSYQYWDLTFPCGYYSIGNPMNSGQTVFGYLRADGSGNVYQYSVPDSWCMWQVLCESGGTVAFYNMRWGKYLAICSGAVGLSSSIASNSKWLLTSISCSSFRISCATGGSTYYLESDIDGIDLIATTTYSDTIPFWWNLNANCLATIAEFDTCEFLKSDNDGTVSLTGTSGYSTLWVVIQRDSTYTNFVLQSLNDTYLEANGTTGMIEDTTSPFLYPGALSTSHIFKLTVLGYSRMSKQLGAPSRRRENKKEEKEEKKPFMILLKKLQDCGFDERDKNIEALVATKANLVDAVKYLTLNCDGKCKDS